MLGHGSPDSCILAVGGLKHDNETWLIIVACLLHQACQAGRGASI